MVFRHHAQLPEAPQAESLLLLVERATCAGGQNRHAVVLRSFLAARALRFPRLCARRGTRPTGGESEASSPGNTV